MEALIAVGIVAVAAGALLAALSAGSRFATGYGAPERERALAIARMTLHDAAQAWKYGSPGNFPYGTATLPGFSITVASVPEQSDGEDIRVTVRYTPDPQRNESGSVEADESVRARAPLPGTLLTRPGLVPAPSASPACC